MDEEKETREKESERKRVRGRKVSEERNGVIDNTSRSVCEFFDGAMKTSTVLLRDVSKEFAGSLIKAIAALN